MKTPWLFFLLLTIPIVGRAQPHMAEAYGALADGTSNNTTALQAAIDACAARGGGTVVLGQGTYLSGSLRLKNGVGLRILPNATLKAVADTSRIAKFQCPIPSRLDVVPWKAFIYAEGQQNIRLDGGGTLDASGGAPCFLDGVENSPNRHYGLFVANCQNVVVQDLRMVASAFWMQRYFHCQNVRLHRLWVYNHANKNNDGIDIDSSQEVVVSDCVVDSSDDGIVVKANGSRPARNIVIANCIVATHASAIKLGTGSVGGFENIVVTNMVIRPSAAPHMIHPLGVWGGLTGVDIIATDGGALRQVLLANIAMEGVENPIHIRLGNRLSGHVARQGYGGDGDGRQGVKAGPGGVVPTAKLVLEDVAITNLTARDTGPYPAIVAGLPGSPARRVTLRDITIACARPGSAADLATPPQWRADGYPGRGMYGTCLPAYGLATYHTQGLVVKNFKAIPAQGEPRPAQKHFFRQ